MINLSMDDEDVRRILKKVCEIEDFLRLAILKDRIDKAELRYWSSAALTALSDDTLEVHRAGRVLMIKKDVWGPEQVQQVAVLARYLRYAFFFTTFGDTSHPVLVTRRTLMSPCDTFVVSWTSSIYLPRLSCAVHKCYSFAALYQLVLILKLG